MKQYNGPLFTIDVPRLCFVDKFDKLEEEMIVTRICRYKKENNVSKRVKLLRLPEQLALRRLELRSCYY